MEDSVVKWNGRDVKRPVYINRKGQLVCKKCDEVIGITLNDGFTGVKRAVLTACKCDREREMEHEKKLKEAEYKARYSVCFREKGMANKTFDNDDGMNEDVSKALKVYCEKFPTFKREGKGLLLFGNVGSGKTFYASCIANELLLKGYRGMMTSFSQVTNHMSNFKEDKAEYIEDMCKYDFVIFDDLGVERCTDFVLEMVYNVVDGLYRAGTVLIVTTNLSFQTLAKTDDIRVSRIYDRVLERCHPIKVSSNVSRRREKAATDFEWMSRELGLKQG